MLVLQSLVLAWNRLRQPGNSTLRYHVAADVCDVVRNHAYEDAILSWRSLTCTDVVTMIRHAFDAWQYNSNVVFYETRNASSADVVVGVAQLDDDAQIAVARFVFPNEITVNMNHCWYTDRNFCHAVHGDVVPLAVGLGLTWGAFLCLLLYNLLLHRPRPFLSTPRLLVWVVVLAVPMFALGSLVPCLVCHDLTSILVHEVGHTLGLGHSDDPSQTCGCGTRAVPCTPSTLPADPTASAMYSVAQRRFSLCLSRDDVDGVRTLHGGACADPVWCYESPSTTGYTRVSTSLLYAFVLASLAVFVRNRLLVARRSDAGAVVAPTSAAPRRARPPDRGPRRTGAPPPPQRRAGAPVHRL